jgi:hypothetical protein
MEIELAGLYPVTEEEERLIDAHAERDDEADWEQLSVARIHEQFDKADVMPSTLFDRADETPRSIEQAADTPLVNLDRAAQTPRIIIEKAADTPLVSLDRAAQTPRSIEKAADTPLVHLDRAAPTPRSIEKTYDTSLIPEGGDSDETDSESVFMALAQPSSHCSGPSMANILFMMLTCYAAHASPFSPPSPNAYFEQCYYSAFQEPVSYAEAMRRSDADKWTAAMEEEKSAFFANGTWKVVPIDPSWNLPLPSGFSKSRATRMATSRGTVRA